MVAHRKGKTAVKRSSRTGIGDVAIGGRIKLARLSAGISQGELGVKLGVSFQQVQKYEKGTNRIAGDMIRLLCEELQLDANTLFGVETKTAGAIDRIANLSPDTFNFLETYDKLTPSIRRAMLRLARVMNGEAST